MKNKMIPADRLKAGLTLIGLVFVSFAFLGLPASSQVGEPEIENPVTDLPLCLGYNPTTDKWGRESYECPANHAAYAIDDPAGIEGPAEFIGTSYACCPLPADDILGEEHVFVNEECPENYVATGGKNVHCGEKCEKQIKCTAINSERYQLGAITPGKYWGRGASGWEGAERIRRGVIPLGMRTAVGRNTFDGYDIDGCVGYPFGSLFVKKSSKYCSGLYFKQLQYAGLPGDPSQGSAVKMFPDCRRIENAEDPANARCVY